MKKSFVYLAGIAVILSACAKEIETHVTKQKPEEGIANGKELVTIVASLPETKSTAAIDGSIATYNWQLNDKLSVVEQDATSGAEFTLVNAEAASAGAFSGEKTGGKDLVYAVTPASVLTSALEDGGNILYDITLPSTYSNYVPGTTNAVMVGTPNGEIDGKYKFELRHAAALMKVTYVNVPIGTYGMYLTTDQNINGTWADIDTTNPELAIQGSGEKTTYLEFEEPVYEANQAMDFYIPVPTGDYGSFNIALYDDSGDDIAGTKKKKNSTTNLHKADLFATPVINLDAATKGAEWTHTFSDKNQLNTEGASVNGLTIISSVNCNSIESSGSARGAAFSSGVDPTITIPYTGFIESVVVVCSTNNGSNTISVKVDDISLGSIQNITKDSPNEIHTFSIASLLRYRKGDIKIIVNNGGSKSTWIKSITINGDIDIRAEANLSYSVTGMNVPIGTDPFINPLNNPNGLLGIVYSSSDSSIASVDSDTGEVSIGSKVGTARITATFGGNEYYRAGSAYYDVEVSELIYVYYWINGVKNTISTIEGESLDAILPANPSCGITGYEFAGWSESTVATTDTEPSYTSKTVVPDEDLTLYAVFVKVSEDIIPATPVSFVPDNCASSAKEYTHNDSINGVQMTVSNGICNSTEFRIYKNQTLTITSTRAISDVDITGVSGNPASNFNEPSGWEKTTSGDDGNWHASTSKTSITLTASSAQARASEIVVTLASYSSPTYSGYTTTPVE